MPLTYDQLLTRGLLPVVRAPVVLEPVVRALDVPLCPGYAVRQQQQQQQDEVAVLLPLQEAPPALSLREQFLLRQLLNGEDPFARFAPDGRRLAYRCENPLMDEVLLPRKAGAGAGAGSPAGVLSPEGDTEPAAEDSEDSEDSDDEDDLYD
jgi:hypothetical protein